MPVRSPRARRGRDPECGGWVEVGLSRRAVMTLRKRGTNAWDRGPGRDGVIPANPVPCWPHGRCRRVRTPQVHRVSAAASGDIGDARPSIRPGDFLLIVAL